MGNTTSLIVLLAFVLGAGAGALLVTIFGTSLLEQLRKEISDQFRREIEQEYQCRFETENRSTPFHPAA